MRKVTSAESTKMANQRERLQPILEEAKTDRPQRQMTMEDFWRPVIQDEYSTMRQPAIEANNFELKLAFITMVQYHQFTGHPYENILNNDNLISILAYVFMKQCFMKVQWNEQKKNIVSSYVDTREFQ